MSYTPVSPVPVRVLLFKSNLLDALHLRLAIDMSPLWCDVQVVEESLAALRRISTSIRAGVAPPEMILFDCDLLDPDCLQLVREVRETRELEDLPLVVVGDPESPDAASLARHHGATAFVPRPLRTGDLARVGREIARIWNSTELLRAETSGSLATGT